MDQPTAEEDLVKQFISFRIENFLFGIDIRHVREINQLLDITPVQQTSDYIRGLVNLRGQIVTIFDIAVRLGFPGRTIGPDTHNIVFKHENAGLLADEIGDVMDIEDSAIDTPPVNMSGEMSRYVEGVVRLDSELFLILSPGKILEKPGENIGAGEAV
ncbi:MAG: chemotaxis protein CheW [Desulfarculaceae bacterium]|nr:chemotaxis protein CheW [Desulfarculaceae bacterium]